MLPEQLTATAHGIRTDPAPSTQAKATSRCPPPRMERRNQPALCTEGRPVRGVLDVATSHYPSVVDQCRRTDRKVRVRRVRVTAGRNGGSTQPVPVDLDHRHDGGDGIARRPDRAPPCGKCREPAASSASDDEVGEFQGAIRAERSGAGEEPQLLLENAVGGWWSDPAHRRPQR